jgi:hypothetical protein
MQLFLQSAYLSSALSLIYIGLLYHSHPLRRLPIVSIFTTFAVGMLAVIPVMLLYRFLPGLHREGIQGAVLVAPVIEEAIKFLLFAITVRHLGYPSLIEPLDYAIFFGVLGLGFGVYEDFWYIFGNSYSSWISGDHSRFIEVFRWMAYARSFPGHILFNAIAGFLVGWGICRAEGRSRWAWFAGAFITAVLAHSLFNLAASQPGTMLLWTLIAAYLGVFLFLRHRVLAVSPFVALRELIRSERSEWGYKLSPVEVLFAEGFSWPARTKREYFAFYPVTLSLIVLFPILVSCVYLIHRLLSLGART